MFSYFSTFEDEFSLAMRQITKEAFGEKPDHYHTTRKMVREIVKDC